MQQLNAAGFKGQVIKTFTTSIWSPTLSGLAETLEFFFVDRLEQYRANMPGNIAALEKCGVSSHAKGVASPVTECLIEITRAR